MGRNGGSFKVELSDDAVGIGDGKWLGVVEPRRVRLGGCAFSEVYNGSLRGLGLLHGTCFLHLSPSSALRAQRTLLRLEN